MGARATQPRGVCKKRRDEEQQCQEPSAANITVFHEGKNGGNGEGFHHAGVSGAMLAQRSRRGRGRTAITVIAQVEAGCDTLILGRGR